MRNSRERKRPPQHRPKQHGRFSGTPKKDGHQRIVEGIVRTTAKGIGFLTNEDTGDTIRIEQEFLNTALNGDVVRVSLLPQRRRDELSGEVVEILLRNKMEYVGVLLEENGLLFLRPQDPKMYRDIVISPARRNGATSGQKVLGRIISWETDEHDPEGEIVRVIGTPGDNDTEMSAIVFDKGFIIDFPVGVTEEADALHKNAKQIFADEIPNRRDMRDATTFTIDPETAKDFDDALSVQTLPDGSVEIGIHIADVSFFVKEGSEIDKEAERRGTSIYLVDRTIPMLPEVLSNDLCSLNPKEDKLAYSVVCTFSPATLAHQNPRPDKIWYGRTTIRSDHRFSYESAQKVLDTNEGPYLNELTILRTLAKKMRTARQSDGAIMFESEEVRFRLDERGKPIEAYVKPLLETNNLIEEFMLLANRAVAHYVGKEKKFQVFVYRIHDKPDQDRLKELATFLHGLGYEIADKVKKSSNPRAINALLAEAEGKAEEHIVQTATIRSMAKAIYSTKNIGHYGLGFEYYTHFTSPIRRYPDMLVHRLLTLCLSGQHPRKDDAERLKKLVDYASQMEQGAQDAERSSIKYKQAEYMQERVGQEFDGVISGIADWGIFIEEEQTKCEGLVRFADLDGDYYTYDREKFCVTGERTGRKFQLGDKVRVKVLGVDMEKRLIQYQIV